MSTVKLSANVSFIEGSEMGATDDKLFGVVTIGSKKVEVCWSGQMAMNIRRILDSDEDQELVKALIEYAGEVLLKESGVGTEGVTAWAGNIKPKVPESGGQA
jgi:hypothetical protein